MAAAPFNCGMDGWWEIQPIQHLPNRWRSAHREVRGLWLVATEDRHSVCLWDVGGQRLGAGCDVFAAVPDTRFGHGVAGRWATSVEMPKSHNPLDAYSPNTV